MNHHDIELPQGYAGRPFGYSGELYTEGQMRAAIAAAIAATEIEALRAEIGRLLDSREREGDRLDWLLARLPGSVIRDLVGVLAARLRDDKPLTPRLVERAKAQFEATISRVMELPDAVFKKAWERLRRDGEIADA